MISDRFSDENLQKRDVPSFIEPRPPLISNPFMRPRPQKGTNLMDLFEEESDCEEPELVQVYLRLKPCDAPSNLYEVRSDRCLITSLDTITAGHGRRTQHNVSKMYTFSHIFRPDTTQKDIFEHVVKDNLKKLPEGRSFTLLTYGASGSGKTFTLMGTVASPGLVPRSLEYVFKIVDVAQVPAYKPGEGGVDLLNYAEQEYELQWVKRLRKVSAPLRDKYRRMSAQLSSDLTVSHMDLSNSTRHYVWVSFIEIYNEGVYDLLVSREKGHNAKLAIREDSNGNVYVKGATQAFVRSGEEAYDVMVAGKHQLQVAATGVHAHSSRSHCIFTITMITETGGGCITSCVRLCDLAGCERARRTRNTGARMAESRAINSSLHVLERCLHTLRRKQAASQPALVPYRESKLTRLLGAGLSGTRGEAVSMVVTLNPAAEYAHETRHVLQLAAVAKDIQINNTISEYPSSLESSTQDTTIGVNADIMKLRSDNERLHFELVQAQARNKELVSCMEERQAASADTMRELVEEAKEMTRQYYETQLASLRAEMEEMAEEYESKITELSRRSTVDTPSRNKKITQLMTEIAVLEEKLTAEKLARARAEEEMQHLRACIEERDEKEEAISNEDVMSVTETDSDSDTNDPCNESLEPTFRRENLERSRIKHSLSAKSLSVQNNSDSDDSVLESSNDTLKDTSDREDHFTDNIDTCKKVNRVTKEESYVESPQNLIDVKVSLKGSYFFKDDKKDLRGTYCVSKSDISDPYLDANGSFKENNDTLNKSEDKNKSSDERKSVIDSLESHELIENNNVNETVQRTSSKGNCSLAQFEQLEKASKISDRDIKKTSEEFGKLDTLKETKKYFDNDDNDDKYDNKDIVKKKYYFRKSATTENDDAAKTDYSSPPIIKDEVTNEHEPSMMKKLLGKNLTKLEVSGKKSNVFRTSVDSVDLFESPHVIHTEPIDNIRKSLDSIKLSEKPTEIKEDTRSLKDEALDLFKVPSLPNQNVEIINNDDETDKKIIKKESSQTEILTQTEVNTDVSQIITNTTVDNTIEEFEKIYKDITLPRATEFDLLITQENEAEKESSDAEIKYNLRKKSQQRTRKDRKGDIEETIDKIKDEVLLESHAKCESKRPKRNLRLRRMKNIDSEENGFINTEEKLKDIVNLQSEFSDVTMDMPATKKNVEDIPSPEKGDENLPPLGIQSCPAKSITRSRRKLFTPRAEPLEESLSHTGDSNERIRVPRPSYHRPRARRKL